MRPAIFAAALIFVSSTASAQAVYKCAVKGKPASYQSQPCVGAAAKIWDATPAPALSAEQIHLRQAQQTADSTYLSRIAGTDGQRRAAPIGAAISARSRPDTACESARANRDDILYKRNLNISNEGRRRLHDAVYDACK